MLLCYFQFFSAFFNSHSAFLKSLLAFIFGYLLFFSSAMAFLYSHRASNFISANSQKKRASLPASQKLKREL